MTYQCRDLARRCLASLQRHPLSQGPMAVHVVDNASTDGTAEMVSKDFPWARLRALERNRGFSAANNLVLRLSTAPYALLLNPDTEIAEGALDHLVELMERKPQVALCGCRLVKRDGSFDHAAKRSFPTPLGALAHFWGLGRYSRAGRWLGQYRAPVLDEHDCGEVDAVNGAFMLVRREAREQVGLLDEGYWLYMEDLDWCYRFKQHGWRVWYEGGLSVLHVKGGSSGARRAPRQNIAFHRGMARFYRKFYGPGHPLKATLVYSAIAGKLVISLVRGALGSLVFREGRGPSY